MSEPKPITGGDLGKAVCKHFNLDPSRVHSECQIDFRPQAMASIKLTIMLTADDLAGIAREAGASGYRQFECLGEFTAPPAISRVRVSNKVADTLRRYDAGNCANDKRLDEAIELLKQIVANQVDGVQSVVQVTPAC